MYKEETILNGHKKYKTDSRNSSLRKKDNAFSMQSVSEYLFTELKPS